MPSIFLKCYICLCIYASLISIVILIFWLTINQQNVRHTGPDCYAIEASNRSTPCSNALKRLLACSNLCAHMGGIPISLFPRMRGCGCGCGCGSSFRAGNWAETRAKYSVVVPAKPLGFDKQLCQRFAQPNEFTRRREQLPFGQMSLINYYWMANQSLTKPIMGEDYLALSWCD